GRPDPGRGSHTGRPRPSARRRARLGMAGRAGAGPAAGHRARARGTGGDQRAERHRQDHLADDPGRTAARPHGHRHRRRLADRWPADLLRARIGFFGEDGHLFATTVLENLRVARGDLSADHARRVLTDVGLGPWLAELPGGVDTVLVGGAEAVSGGQRRRLLLARALVSPAQVLLLDEPTEHLDDASGAALQRALLDPDSALVPPETTVLVVSHRLPAEVQDQARTITLA